MKTVSGKQFCSILERHGWVLDRIRGSHYIYSKLRETAILTVPVHGNRDLRSGLQRKLMKMAGLDEADL